MSGAWGGRGVAGAITAGSSSRVRVEAVVCDRRRSRPCAEPCTTCTERARRLLGVDHLAGSAPFGFDPSTPTPRGVVTNPDVVVAGEPGTGESATVKSFVRRAVTVRGR